MTVYLHNTLTGKKEEFKSLKKDVVSLYSCGPTVYNYAHIGNLRAYVFVDTLRRVLEYAGYHVKHVMNITDVGHLSSDADDGEDKMTKALLREGKPLTLPAMRDVAEFYTREFENDLRKLNILHPHEMPRASDHIASDIEIISILFKKGVAYKTSDGIYYDISKFPEYGKLGSINLDGQESGARVAINVEKRNPRDFALWKFNQTLGWDTPWGKGFPGWHIECSGMSRHFLGQPFDIHTGGIDHIPVHHNNEIAQSEMAYDVPLARYWLHNNHVTMAGEKASKSKGNILYLKDFIECGVSPLAYRYFLLLASYRTQVAFTDGIVEKIAVPAVRRLYSTLAGLPLGGSIASHYKEKFTGAVTNDLNTAEGIAILHTMLADERVSPADKLATALDFDRVLGLSFAEERAVYVEKMSASIPAVVLELFQKRNDARAKQAWADADRLRDDIEAHGFDVLDTDGGSKVVPRK